MDEKELLIIDDLMERFDDHFDWWGDASSTSEWFDGQLCRYLDADPMLMSGILHNEFQQHLAAKYREVAGQFDSVLWTAIIEMMRPADPALNDHRTTLHLVYAIKDEWKMFRCPLQRIASALRAAEIDHDLDPEGWNG